MISLAVITACSRPENLRTLHTSLDLLPPEVNPVWYIGFDYFTAPAPEVILWALDKEAVLYRAGSGGDCSGAPQKNRGLQLCKEEWVYFLDDDTLIHKGFAKSLSQVVGSSPGVGVIVFGQCDGSGCVLRLAEEARLGVGHVDLGQMIFRRDQVGGVLFREGCYESDGYFFRDVLDSAVIAHYSSDVCTYYNALRLSS